MMRNFLATTSSGELLQQFIQWLEEELGNPCKKWCNFYTRFRVEYLDLLNNLDIGLKYLSFIDGDMTTLPSITDNSFVSTCPFNTNNFYVTLLDKEESIDIKPLLELKLWCSPGYPCKYEVYQLSVDEYNACTVYKICKSRLLFLQEIKKSYY